MEHDRSREGSNVRLGCEPHSSTRRPAPPQGTRAVPFNVQRRRRRGRVKVGRPCRNRPGRVADGRWIDERCAFDARAKGPALVAVGAGESRKGRWAMEKWDCGRRRRERQNRDDDRRTRALGVTTGPSARLNGARHADTERAIGGECCWRSQACPTYVVLVRRSRARKGWRTMDVMSGVAFGAEALKR